MESESYWKLKGRLNKCGVRDEEAYISHLHFFQKKNFNEIQIHILNEFNIHASMQAIKDCLKKDYNINHAEIPESLKSKYKYIQHESLDEYRFCPRCRKKYKRGHKHFSKCNLCRGCKCIIDKKNRVKNKDKISKYNKSKEFVFSQLKYQAKKRGFVFELSLDYYRNNLSNKPCHYCGEDNTKHWIDRIINNIGYTKENSVSCCELCNKMKSHRDLKVFVDHCKKVAKFNS